MKKINIYISEHISKNIDSYIEEGLFDWLKNFWDWLTGQEKDKMDYDDHGYYNPNVDLNEFKNGKIINKRISEKQYEKVIDMYFTVDDHYNKNSSKFSFKEPKNIDKSKIKYVTILYKSPDDKNGTNAKILGVMSYIEYNDVTYILKLDLIKKYLRKFNYILKALYSEERISNNFNIITKQSDKTLFLEEIGFTYNDDRYIKEINE